MYFLIQSLKWRHSNRYYDFFFFHLAACFILHFHIALYSHAWWERERLNILRPLYNYFYLFFYLVYRRFRGCQWFCIGWEKFQQWKGSCRIFRISYSNNNDGNFHYSSNKCNTFLQKRLKKINIKKCNANACDYS